MRSNLSNLAKLYGGANESEDPIQTILLICIGVAVLYLAYQHFNKKSSRNYSNRKRLATMDATQPSVVANVAPSQPSVVATMAPSQPSVVATMAPTQPSMAPVYAATMAATMPPNSS